MDHFVSWMKKDEILKKEMCEPSSTLDVFSGWHQKACNIIQFCYFIAFDS